MVPSQKPLAIPVVTHGLVGGCAQPGVLEQFGDNSHAVGLEYIAFSLEAVREPREGEPQQKDASQVALIEAVGPPRQPQEVFEWLFACEARMPLVCLEHSHGRSRACSCCEVARRSGGHHISQCMRTVYTQMNRIRPARAT